MVSGKSCLCCGPSGSWLVRRRSRRTTRRKRTSRRDPVVMRPVIEDYGLHDRGHLGSMEDQRVLEEPAPSPTTQFILENRQLITDMRAQNFDVIRFATYRTACKLRFIQKKTNLFLVDIWNVIEAFRENGLNSLEHRFEVPIDRMESLLSNIFYGLNKRLPTNSQIDAESSVNMLYHWMISAYDHEGRGTVSVFSIKVALSIMCAGKLMDKLRYIFTQISDSSGHLVRGKFDLFLKEILSLPTAVFEGPSFGYNESACRSCFNWDNKVNVNDFLDALMRDPGPQCLMWLPILHRMATVENVLHPVLCEACRRESFAGFRYKCQHCFNYHLCQDCFWRGRTSGNHSNEHEMKEYSSYKSPAKQIGQSLKKSFRCVPAKAKIPQFPEAPEKPLDLAHIVQTICASGTQYSRGRWDVCREILIQIVNLETLDNAEASETDMIANVGSRRDLRLYPNGWCHGANLPYSVYRSVMLSGCPPSPLPAHNGFHASSLGRGQSGSLDVSSMDSSSATKSPSKVLHGSSTIDPARVDDEHRLIARYAARLAADANHARRRHSAEMTTGERWTRSPSELSLNVDSNKAQRELIAQLEAKNREIMTEIQRLRIEHEQNTKAVNPQLAAAAAGGSAGGQPRNPTLLAELRLLRQRRDELEGRMAALQESRRELMVQLEGLMKLLKSHNSPQSTPNSSPRSRNPGSPQSASLPRGSSAPSTPGDPLSGVGGDVRQAFGTGASTTSSMHSLRNDLLVAADSVTNAMSSLVKELNSGWMTSLTGTNSSPGDDFAAWQAELQQRLQKEGDFIRELRSRKSQSSRSGSGRASENDHYMMTDDGESMNKTDDESFMTPDDLDSYLRTDDESYVRTDEEDAELFDHMPKERLIPHRYTTDEESCLETDQESYIRTDDEDGGNTDWEDAMKRWINR
ncbi:hypothetical protein CAPTEDRAFT_221719 [Capitella teleta]|uniref:ZZ-type domain-containing protein n=1 Tax=Capitella teleta TaxID=283909 RepID=R7U8R5_CAPTE|nr:hypothetical protein CAPTEDRAFT_221719 [Capitella teleta]|eukprot:ELU02511.1 hypothetical protein CAPTEDRAFT_221719 [Capitella teleta]